MQVSGLLTLPGSFTCGQRTLVPTQQEAGWATVSVWKFWRGKKNILSQAGNSIPDCPAHSVVNILIVLTWHSLMGSKKNHKQLHQDAQYPQQRLGQDISWTQARSITTSPNLFRTSETTYKMSHIRRNKLNTYQLEYLSVAAHQSEIYVWSQDHNHFCAALSEIHTLLSAYNMRAWNLSKNALNNVKGKIHLRTGHEAQKWSIALSLTSVLDGGGVSSTPHPSPFTNGKETLHPLYRKLSGTQGGLDGCQKSPSKNAWSIYPVASRYTDYTVHLIMCWKETNQLMAMLLLQLSPQHRRFNIKLILNEWLRIITSLPLILLWATSVQFKSIWQIMKMSSYLCLNFPSSIF